MLGKLTQATLRLRIPIVVAVVLLTAGSIYLLPRIHIDADYLNYLPPDDSDVKLFKQVGRQFGGTFIAMVALETPNVFSGDALKEIRRFTRAVEEMDEVSEVVSLTNILDIRDDGSGGLQVGQLIDRESIPTDPKQLSRLRKYVLAKDMYRDALVSGDGKVALVMCRLKLDADKLAVGRRLRKIAASTIRSAQVTFGGIPMLMDYTMQMIVRDMTVLIPIVLVVVGLILFLSFRTIRGVVLPLLVVAVATLLTLGVMVLLGRPLTLISAIMPVVLIATGSAYGIHLLNRHREVAGNGGDKRESVIRTIATIGTPIGLAGLTTFAGFISLRTSSMVIFQDFGTFTAIGVVISLGLTLFLLPVILSWLPLPSSSLKKRDAGGLSSSLLTRVGRFVHRHPRWVLGLVVVVLAVSANAIPHLRREINLLSFFKPGSEPRVADDLLKKRFGGSNPLIFRVDGDPAEPYVLRAMQAFERRLKQFAELGRPQSYADLIEEMSDVMLDRRTVPETKRGLKNLKLLLEGQEIMKQLVDEDHRQLVVQVNMRELDSAVVDKTLAGLKRLLSEAIPQDLIVMDVPSPAHKHSKYVASLRATQIAAEIEAEVSSRRSGVSLQQLVPVIKQGIASTTGDALFAAHQREVINVAGKYLRSDSAELELDAKTVQAIEKALGGRLRDAKGLAKLLESIVPAADVEDDPKVLADLARSLEQKILDALDGLRARSLLQSVARLLPKDLAKDQSLMDGIGGAIWVVNDRTIGVPYKEYVRRFGQPTKHVRRVQLGFTPVGIPVIVWKLNTMLVGSQLKSLAFALVVVILILGVQLRSFLGGLMASFPIVLTVAVNFTLMAILGIALDAATAIIAGVAIGIGIDYTIHFITRYNRDLEAGLSKTDAVEATLKTSGRAILINAASVMAGFLVLLFSAIIALQRFGWLTALTMVFSAGGALIVFPALALVFRPSFLFQHRKTANSQNKEA